MALEKGARTTCIQESEIKIRDSSEPAFNGTSLMALALYVDLTTKKAVKKMLPKSSFVRFNTKRKVNTLFHQIMTSKKST